MRGASVLGACLWVGLGGFVGSVGRYLLSLLPVRGPFPLATLLTNLLGAVLIGLVVGLAGRAGLEERLLLFLKTGVCGGFTTFSTFSLETWQLAQQGRPLLGAAYAAASVLLCLAGVALGGLLARLAAR